MTNYRNGQKNGHSAIWNKDGSKIDRQYANDVEVSVEEKPSIVPAPATAPVLPAVQASSLASLVSDVPIHSTEKADVHVTSMMASINGTTVTFSNGRTVAVHHIGSTYIVLEALSDDEKKAVKTTGYKYAE